MLTVLVLAPARSAIPPHGLRTRPPKVDRLPSTNRVKYALGISRWTFVGPVSNHRPQRPMKHLSHSGSDTNTMLVMHGAVLCQEDVSHSYLQHQTTTCTHRFCSRCSTFNTHYIYHSPTRAIVSQTASERRGDERHQSRLARHDCRALPSALQGLVSIRPSNLASPINVYPASPQLPY